MDKPVGLTGGICTGKSTVAKMFLELGAHIICADDIASIVLADDSPAVHALVKYFGKIILKRNNALDRKTMLNILLKDADNMKHQLDVLRPYILSAVDKEVVKLRDKSGQDIIIVEAPLLFEYGRPERYHPIIVVTAPRSIQIERLVKRSGMNQKRAASVVDLQIPIEEKGKLADWIIDNSLNIENTRIEVGKIHKELLKNM